MCLKLRPRIVIGSASVRLALFLSPRSRRRRRKRPATGRRGERGGAVDALHPEAGQVTTRDHHPVGLDYWITPGRPGGWGSSLSDLLGPLPTRPISAWLPDTASWQAASFTSAADGAIQHRRTVTCTSRKRARRDLIIGISPD